MMYRRHKTLCIAFFLVILTGCQQWNLTHKTEERIPFYPESTIISNNSYSDSFQVTLEAADTNEAITDYYAKTLRIEGWQVLIQRDNFLAFSRSGEGVMIDIEASGPSKRMITISYLADANNFNVTM